MDPAEKPPVRLRVYQDWQGNEKFFCWGYLVAGPNWRASLGTAFLIAAPTGVFLALVAPYLTREVHAIIMVFSCLLPTLSMVFLFMTACRDPGIIPRQEPDEEYLSGRKPRTKEVFVNNQRVLIRYNDTCHFYQPPRAHHCSVNDNCIERFDHHCPWVGTTIGKRNYRTFLLFIYTTTILCLYVFGCCLAHLFVRHDELEDEAKARGETGSVWGDTLADVPATIALMVFTFLFFWFVGGLSMLHCYLVATNQTTYENFRYNQDGRRNPYNLGIFGNCAEVWCTAMPPSQVGFRSYADEARRAPPQLGMVGMGSEEGQDHHPQDDDAAAQRHSPRYSSDTVAAKAQYAFNAEQQQYEQHQQQHQQQQYEQAMAYGHDEQQYDTAVQIQPDGSGPYMTPMGSHQVYSPHDSGFAARPPGGYGSPLHHGATQGGSSIGAVARPPAWQGSSSLQPAQQPPQLWSQPPLPAQSSLDSAPSGSTSARASGMGGMSGGVPALSPSAVQLAVPPVMGGPSRTGAPANGPGDAQLHTQQRYE